MDNRTPAAVLRARNDRALRRLRNNKSTAPLDHFTVESDEDGASLTCTQCGWWITIDGEALGDLVEAASAHNSGRHEV